MVLKLVREINIVVLVLLLLHVEFTVTSTSGMPWHYADQIIQAVCPTTSICNVPLSDKGWPDQCCTPCRCGNGCSAGNCCFRNNTRSDYETCLYLTSKFNNVYRFTPLEKKFTSYYVVSKAPYPGCYKSKGRCDSTDTNSIYPVFSQETGKIYFNNDCAVCHGVEEVVDPRVAVFCDRLGTSEEINFEEELVKFLDGKGSSFCFLYFEFPAQNISPRECSIHAVESNRTFINITNEVHLKEQYNMTIDDMTKACISDFFAPVLIEPKKKLYPNPFCYLLGEGTHIKDVCYTTTGVGIDFIMLLNPDITGVLRLDKESVTKHQVEVCNGNTSWSPFVQSERCRPVFCPIGHIVNKNGECTFISDRIMDNGRMNRCLNLILTSTTDTLMNETNIDDITIDYLSEIIKLPVEWEIAFWGISAQSHFNDVREIIIILKLDIINYGLIEGTSSIKSHINKIVPFLNEPCILSVYQKRLFIKKKAPEVLKVPLCSLYNDMTELTSCWKIIEFNPGLPKYTALDFEPLSKLYFCDLVQLTNFEYRLEANELWLYNKIVSRYMYDNEFIILTGENGDATAKICLADSGFSKPEANASYKTDISTFVLVVMLCTVMTGHHLLTQSL